MADNNRNRYNQSSDTGNNNQNSFSSYRPRYRGPDTESKGMGNDFTGGTFGSNTRSDGFWERTAQEAGSADAARGMGNPWQSGGTHRGKGPRGYQRSTERIKEDVCERLTDDGDIDATDIEVKVEQDEIILSGTVHSRAEKRRAEDIAESVSGVRDVQNRLRVDDSSNSDKSSDLGHIM